MCESEGYSADRRWRPPTAHRSSCIWLMRRSVGNRSSRPVVRADVIIRPVVVF